MSRPLRILHGADFHLDTPFTPQDFGMPQQRREQLRQAAVQALGLGGEHDLILLAGDVFDAAAYPETVQLLQDVLAGLGCPVFISPGNHDPFTPSSPWAAYQWPENVHIFTSSQIEAVELPALNCTVYGAAFQGDTAHDLLRGFRAEGPGRKVMLLHGDGLNRNSEYNYVNPEDVAASGLDYLALGHIHAPCLPKQAGGTWYGWPGCLLGRDFGEPGPHGVFSVELSDAGCRTRLVETPGPRWLTMQVRADGDAAAALKQARNAVQAGDHLRLTLSGVCPAFDAAPFFEGLASFCLTDQTLRPEELWADAGAETLRGLFLQALKARYEAAEDPAERRLAQDAALWGLAALEGREAPC